ncbi:hypothetical protein WS70_17730 [Burkholderia mayonis]|uniref:Uncharacterized protein n=1 Tax=Burkholderia mayonis TaxID=1385591 RepID=A0A1B4FJH3_9BURK|nr:hypothetical protein WS70_17730 [Burkholderia mayonis]
MRHRRRNGFEPEPDAAPPPASRETGAAWSNANAGAVAADSGPNVDPPSIVIFHFEFASSS